MPEDMWNQLIERITSFVFKDLNLPNNLVIVK